ncbi:DUF3348 domain-containing protein [Xanthomonas graminis]|jgi:hypothetical protein|nr:DUF3348 domain-containing protein [Xanthomonas translucens]OAX58977.1 hypothetical protein A6R72_03435 [Xanthomonas translucens pv. graminis]UKE53725.1 DUF3348 domain-containing protein [Xanthomonas translucens pv. graminis]WIH08041.1 DUF3348 domain-containing protein [Xanthomonas translucens pv. graminis]WIH13203.1 DUF3348 domain-containing protein [Xanthomonas translucens pv. graminis]WIH16802.1 DUF3348 domain-containing protein [Xanthomonas translucens pv. graminis]
MAKALPRPPVPGPAFIRLLARLTDADIPPSSPALADRLGQWIDWTRAVAVSRALDGRMPTLDEDTPFESASETECARVRGALEQSIASDTGADAGRQAVAPGHGADPNAPLDYAPFRQRYLSLQRAMLTASGRLRGQLRDTLARSSADMARLAEVDAVMELTLSPREQTLLAAVPALLGQHFERLREAAQPVPDAAQTAHTAPSAGAWLDVFRQDMQHVLRAELDIRFHPIEGLLAALRSR